MARRMASSMVIESCWKRTRVSQYSIYVRALAMIIEFDNDTDAPKVLVVCFLSNASSSHGIS
jgi:hypothetical protein